MHCNIIYILQLSNFISVGEIKKQSSVCKEEVKRLRSVLSSLDKDRDSLQNEVDKKAEVMDVLEDEKKQLKQRSKQLETSAEELESRLKYVSLQLSQDAVII